MNLVGKAIAQCNLLGSGNVKWNSRKKSFLSRFEVITHSYDGYLKYVSNFCFACYIITEQ